MLILPTDMKLAPPDLSPLLIAGALGVGVSTWLFTRRSRHTSYPPGPSPDPVIGNLRQMGTGSLEYVFHEWGKEYGEPPSWVTEGVSSNVLTFRRRSDNPRVGARTEPCGPELIRRRPRTA